MPLTGHVDEISRSRIGGWVYDATHPNETVSLSIFVNGVHKGSCAADQPRPDLEGAADVGATTNRAFAFTFNPPLSPFLTHQVEVVETWSAIRLPNGFRILPRPTVTVEGGLTPVLVTSTGRAGTTMLMSEFTRHKNIVVGDRYPYEIKQVAYHVAAFRALVADSDRDRSTEPDTMMSRDMSQFIGGNPYNLAGLFDLGTTGERLRNYYHSSVPNGYATLYRTLIQEFYSTLAAGQGKSSASLFCEKGDIDDTVIRGARLFFGIAKEIVLVRDPRDLLCSAIAFWKMAPDAALRMLRDTFPRLTRAARQASSDTIVIRYEDLIREPVGVRRAMSEFLGVDLLAAPAAGGEAVASSHRTSQDSASSIGRWRQDLTAQQIAACELAFGPSMRAFDYEAGDAAAERARSSARRRMEGENQIVAAEGSIAVDIFLDEELSREGARTVFELAFGTNSAGGAFLLGGWSRAERDYVWSNAAESQMRLPAIRQTGTYQFRIVATPFTRGEKLPVQRVTVLLNEEEVGTVQMRDICVLILAVPELHVASDKPITLTFRFPDAARPSEVFGSSDTRLLGMSLHRVTLVSIDARREANEQALGPPVAYVGAPVEVPPVLTPEWRVIAGD